LADDDNFYILRHQQEEDNWLLDSFRVHDNQGEK
jgi:hypothetical protein